jgi:hypothetical protein
LFLRFYLLLTVEERGHSHCWIRDFVIFCDDFWFLGSRQSAVGNSAIARHRAIARAIATLLMIVLYLDSLIRD